MSMPTDIGQWSELYPDCSTEPEASDRETTMLSLPACSYEGAGPNMQLSNITGTAPRSLESLTAPREFVLFN